MRVSAAGNMPLQGLVKPPAKPVVMIWHGYCAPCFTTGKFIEEAAAVMDYRLAALLEKS